MANRRHASPAHCVEIFAATRIVQINALSALYLRQLPIEIAIKNA
jgi:hypothetical protein